MLAEQKGMFGSRTSSKKKKKEEEKRTKKKAHREHRAWFLANSFDPETHYGIVSNPKRNLGSMAEGAEVVNTEVELMSVAGMVPFGWNRSNCMLCWSAPVWIVNLVRLCGGPRGDGVGFYQDETDIEAWPKIEKPVVFGCGNGQAPFDDLTRGEEGSEQQTFLRAKLFEGLAEEEEELPGWSDSGAIRGCSSGGGSSQDGESGM